MLRTRIEILVAIALFAPVLQAQAPSRAVLDTEFRAQLETLAGKCEELNLPERAVQTRDCWIDRDPGRQYLFVPSSGSSE